MFGLDSPQSFASAVFVAVVASAVAVASAAAVASADVFVAVFDNVALVELVADSVGTVAVVQESCL